MIGVISHSFEFAQNVLKSRGDVETFNPASGLGTFFSRREFRIATRPEHLEGVTLSDYMIVGKPEPELIAIARARLAR